MVRLWSELLEDDTDLRPNRRGIDDPCSVDCDAGNFAPRRLIQNEPIAGRGDTENQARPARSRQ